VYSSAGLASTRETLQIFEFVRAFFLQMLGSPANHQPVYIVVFGSARDYSHYQSRTWSAASYHESADHDVIVVGDPSQDSFRTTVHEYFHLWAHRQRLRLPLWLNEGLAQLYSTLRPTLGGQVVGEMPAGFGSYMARSGWVPLQTVLATRAYPLSDQNSEVSAFYLESWALVHMLELSGDYRPGAPKIIPTLDTGLSSQAALEKIYGKALSAIELDLRAYLQNIESRNEVYRGRLRKAPKPVVQPAAEFDRRLVLVRLLEPTTRADEIRDELRALTALDPKRPEPHEELGALAFLGGDAAAARHEFRQAFELGGLGPDRLWEYGRLVEDDPPEAVKVFERLLSLDPGRDDARLELTRMQLASKKNSQR
jgi:hypothetical protein